MMNNIVGLKKLLRLVDAPLEQYKDCFQEIDIMRNKTESFSKILETKIFCDNWPLIYRYDQLKFLSNLDRKDLDGLVFLYGLKKLIEFQFIIVNSKLRFNYDLYLYFDFYDGSFTDEDCIWPRINFCANEKYVGKYDELIFKSKLATSKYAKYIKTFVQKWNLDIYFDIFEWERLDSPLDEKSILLDFKDHFVNKVNVIDFDKLP